VARARADARGAGERRTLLPIVVAAVLVFQSATIAVIQYGLDEEAVRSVVRATARIGVLLFSLTFACSSLHLLFRSKATKWLLRNRRSLGLSFALTHTSHLLALGLLALAYPEPFLPELTLPTLVGGGLAYAFLLAMALTSTDAAVARLGARRWRLLHTLGSYYLWIIFALSYFPRAFESAGYIPAAALLAIALGLRAVRRARLARPTGG
jgi:sulfoxide reductase heme-binding subunit YedZ